MRNHLYQAGVVLAFIAVVAVAYFTMREAQSGDLKDHMSLLGDKLLALVPDDADKASVSGVYGEFLAKVDKREVPPEQVERVAATLFNITNSDEKLTGKQAIALMELSMLPGPEATPGASAPAIAPVVDPGKWADLDRKLRTVFSLNTMIEEHQANLPAPEAKRSGPIIIDNKLRIVVDTKLKEEMQHREHSALAIELKHLEEARLLEWQDNFEQAMELKQQEWQKNLEQMKAEMEKLQTLDEFMGLGIRHASDAVMLLDSLGIAFPVNVDSILQEVHKELQDIKIEISVDTIR